MTTTERTPLVLLIEDTQDIQQAVQMVLEDEGYRTVCADDGRAGLDMLEGGLEPDLILLDLSMPVMTGQEFLRVSRAAGLAAGVPVVVLSATPRPDPALGVDGWLRKPVSVDALIDAVERHCHPVAAAGASVTL